MFVRNSSTLGVIGVVGGLTKPRIWVRDIDRHVYHHISGHIDRRENREKWGSFWGSRCSPWGAPKNLKKFRKVGIELGYRPAKPRYHRSNGSRDITQKHTCKRLFPMTGSGCAFCSDGQTGGRKNLKKFRDGGLP